MDVNGFRIVRGFAKIIIVVVTFGGLGYLIMVKMAKVKESVTGGLKYFLSSI